MMNAPWRSKKSTVTSVTLRPIGADRMPSMRVVECRCGGGTYLLGTRIPGERCGGRSGNPRAQTYRYRWHACSLGQPLNGQSFTTGPAAGIRYAPTVALP
jgi:hypothetical protein